MLWLSSTSGLCSVPGDRRTCLCVATFRSRLKAKASRIINNSIIAREYIGLSRITMPVPWLYAGFPALVDKGFGGRFEELARLHPPGSSDVSKARSTPTCLTHVSELFYACMCLSPVCYQYALRIRRCYRGCIEYVCCKLRSSMSPTYNPIK